MIIGYGRTSTIEQVAGLEAQIRDLKAAGAEKLQSRRLDDNLRKRGEISHDFRDRSRLFAEKGGGGGTSRGLAPDAR